MSYILYFDINTDGKAELVDESKAKEVSFTLGYDDPRFLFSNAEINDHKVTYDLHTLNFSQIHDVFDIVQEYLSPKASPGELEDN
jgi:hypothetical protein